MSAHRILIIDDEEDFCFFVKANLEARGGFRVEIANSGEQGLELAGTFKPHVIILDVIMPEMDGFKVLEALKQDPKTMQIPVLMLSARHDDDSKIEAAALYSERYLTKPVRMDDLLAQLKKILGLRQPP